MSIIHDALKKVERERQPLSMGLPAYRGTRSSHRRWRGVVVVGLLVGATTLGAVSAWRWLRPLGRVSSVSVTAPRPASLTVRAADDEDRDARRAVMPELMLVPQSPLPPPRSRPAEARSAGVAVSLVSAVQATAEGAFEKAREAEAKGQWEQAIQYYRQVIALNPNLVEAHNNLGHLYVRQRQLSAAIGAFQAALAIDTNYAMARNNLGSAYLLLGEDALAIQEFLAAVRIDGTYVSPYYNLALVYARRADVGQSVAFLTKAVGIEPAVLSWLREDADFDRIRAAPEFHGLRTQSHARR
jgi:tetratricopeptide (TPR) repeat protein